MRRALATLALLRMAAPLAPSRTPHSGYHGQGSSTPFFEGWYNRLTLPEAETSVALIFAVFDPGARTPRSGVEAQVLVARPAGGARRVAASRDVSRFAAAPHALDVRATLAGGDAFALTSTRQRGRVDGVAWDFSVEPVLGRRRRRATGACFSGRGSESFKIRPCRPS